LPASAGVVAENDLQTFRSRDELTFRAPVLFQFILVQLPHLTCFYDESCCDNKARFVSMLLADKVESLKTVTEEGRYFRMVRHTTEQRIFLVETYLLKKKSYKRCVRKLRPSKKCVLTMFNKWRETGSVLDKKKLCPKRALTEQRLEDIRVRMEISPRKSSRRVAQECNISKSSVLRGLKALKFHPYKASLVQKLNPADPVALINFCRWTLQCVHDGIIDPTLLFISDEA
jgi:transposase